MVSLLSKGEGMLSRLSKRVLLVRLIVLIVSAQFIFSGVCPVRSYAAWDKIRPVATKETSRLTELKSDYTTGTRAQDLPLFEEAKDASSDMVTSFEEDKILRRVLGDYKVRQTVDNLPFGNYIKKILDASVSKDKLKQIFGAELQTQDEYAVLYFKNLPVALIKKDAQGKFDVKKIIRDFNNIRLSAILEEPALTAAKQKGIKVIDILLYDYIFLEERAKIPMAERMTLDWREMREYDAEYAKKTPGFNISPLFLTGGKGLSLSLVDGLDNVSVPPGFNVTTTAYFKFVKENPQVFEIINKELRTLDTSDDQKRDVISREIREVINNAHIPEEIKREALVMYRQLNIIRTLSGKKTPTAVAVRSSGIKEDIKIESWLPITTGSQAGQSDTYLNVKGEKNVLDKLRADWASLFTDRAISYRDDAIFLIFSSRMGFPDKQPKQVYYDLLTKLRQYAKELNNPEFNSYADTLTNFRNPGSVNLMNAMERILEYEDNKEISHCLDLMKKVAEEFVHPEQIGIDVVSMQMVKSYLAGVIFTVNPATKMAGVPQALYRYWYRGDDSLVYKDEKGRVSGTKPIVISFDISYGYGENVVGGKVDPDKFIMGSYDGVHWFIIEKNKGSKLIQMIDIEEAIKLLQDKMSEESIRNLASMLGRAISYDEVGKRINGILATRLYGTRYLKELADKKEESDKDKKARVQKIAEEIAGMIKAKKSANQVKEFIKEHFYVSTVDQWVSSKKYGITKEVLDRLVVDVLDSVDKARSEAEEEKRILNNYFGGFKSADDFIMMFKEVLENKESELEQRQEVLTKLNLDAGEFRNLSYLMRSLIDKGFTCNLETTDMHRDTFTITDSEVGLIGRMAWNITTYYQDQRDIEFAIEIDPFAPENKRLNLYVIDKDGSMLSMTEKGELVITDIKPQDLAQEGTVSLRLYNVQARPYTADYAKVNFIQQRTEVDEDFIDEKGIKPIAIGTKGENATHAYVLVFDPNKTIDWHAQQINRLKRGEFTDEEKQELIRLGFNPADYGPESEEKLPIALYLLEADPSHDPIMRLVNAVVTIRGGDTCHAAIFCREQRIPAVTGAGKVLLEGRLLKTADGLTIDANNGRVFKLEKDPAKRIPIIYVDRMIKPHGIPGNKVDGEVIDDDGFVIPTIGQILASAKSAQENTPILLAPDSSGYALTRAEFKGEELGINVFAGYGYDFIQRIQSGSITKPSRILIQDLIDGRVKGADKFIAQFNNDAQEHVRNNQHFKDEFKQIFGRDYKKEDGILLLTAFDILRDINTGALTEDKLTLGQDKVLEFTSNIPQESRNFFNYAYGEMQRRFNFDFNIIEVLEAHPWVLEEITKKLKEKGYATFQEYAGQEFYYLYNLMGFTIAPDQKAKNRAYDFAQDKVRGLIGSELFSWPGVNPLVGLRGAALEIEGVDEEFQGNQKILSFLLEAVIDADRNTYNQSWFYVFIRFTRELDTLDIVLDRIAKKKGKLPKQIGIMIEVPSDAILARELANKILKMGDKYAKYGVESVFFSFGTNDYSYLAAKGDREDPRMKLTILDTFALKAIDEIKEAGYFYDESIKKLPLVDEGADVMRQLMEAVVAAANDLGVETSLCGEAVTSLVRRGDYNSAGRIMGMLKSFGVSMMSARLPASMIRFDTMATTKQIVVPEDKRQVLFDLKANGRVLQEKGVVKGEIIYVDSPEDLIADVLKGFVGMKLKETREFLEMQGLESARSTMRTFNKIVVLTRNPIAMTEDEYLGSMSPAEFAEFLGDGLIKHIGGGLYIWTNLNSTEKKFSDELEKKGYTNKEDRDRILTTWQKAYENTASGLKRKYIDWNDLEYAPAIIVDSAVNLEGWDVFSVAKGIVPSRVKATVKDIGKLRRDLEGQLVTIDYAAGKIYKGNLEVKREEAKPSYLPIPEYEPQVETKPAVREDANDAYRLFKYHPLLLLAYEREQAALGSIEDFAGKIFDEYVEGLVDELDKVSKEEDPDKKTYSFTKFKAKVDREPEKIIKNYLQNLIERKERMEEVILPGDWLEDLRDTYFQSQREDISDIRQGIAELLKGKSAQTFIREAFKQNMQEVLSKNKGNLVVHATTSLNSLYFRNMLGGFLIEQTNPNPNYGLLGAARAISDFAEINILELEAFKEVWQSLPVEERKNFGLQITELKGTQSGAVVIAWRNILEGVGITPGRDGLEVGVNISTPTDTLALDKYFEYFNKLGAGLSFVTYDRMMLGAAWSGVDIYWNEWRRLAREKELQDLGDVAIKIVKGKIESANKSKSGKEAIKKVVVFEEKPGYTVQPEVPGPTDVLPAARIQAADTIVYSSSPAGFDNFVDSLKDLQNPRGALVIGANAIFENAGVITTLKTLKERKPADFKVGVWAKDEAEANKLKAMGLENIVDIIDSNGLIPLLLRFGVIQAKAEGKYAIPEKLTPAVLVNAPADASYINKVIGLDLHEFNLKAINVESPNAREDSLNSMPLVIARAIAGILDYDDYAVQKFEEFSRNYSGQTSTEDLAGINNLNIEISSVPLMKVSEEVTRAQITYEETIGKI